MARGPEEDRGPTGAQKSRSEVSGPEFFMQDLAGRVYKRGGDRERGSCRKGEKEHRSLL